MRTLTVVVALIGVSLLGGKCKGPKPPRAEAIDAAEEAFWIANVPDELTRERGATLEVEVDIALDDETFDAPAPEIALVRFTRAEAEVVATVVIGGERFAFVMRPNGDAEPAAE